MTAAASDLRKNSGKFSVYALSDPETDELRYVGMTIKKLEVRLNNHCSEASRKPSASYRTRWLQSVTNRGLRPKIELIEELPDAASMAEAEEYWITQFRAMGFRLVNGNAGGWGGPSRPHEGVVSAETLTRRTKEECQARPFTDGERVFRTLGEAAEHYSVGRTLIRNCLRQKSQTLNLRYVTNPSREVG